MTQTFSDFGLPRQLMNALERAQFQTPTPIQAQAIPLALQGHDVLGSAQTGTGKTGAFGIPVIAKLMEHPEASALILTPTRELAAQVMAALQQWIAVPNIKTALLIGGEAMPKQYRQLRMNPRLIVGTPGRVNDHLLRKSVNLSNTRFLVLDETDRMLDMGFGVQLDAILQHVPQDRQTMMFSATMPANIMKLSAKYLREPQRVSVGNANAVAPKIKQELVQVSEAEKYGELINQLQSTSGTVIVFVKTKYGADKLATKLCREEHKADAIHGDLKQNRRDRVIQDYRAKKFRILVATDVAARGLDIPHIETVINYDMPQAPEDYIHRIGRTARAGATGYAVNLVTPADGSKWKAIHRLMNPDAKPERSERPANKRQGGFKEGGFKGGQRGGFGGGYKSGFGGQGKGVQTGNSFPGFENKPRPQQRQSNDGWVDGPRRNNDRFADNGQQPRGDFRRDDGRRDDGHRSEGRRTDRFADSAPRGEFRRDDMPRDARPPRDFGAKKPFDAQSKPGGFKGGFKQNTKKPFGKPGAGQGAAAGGRRFAKKPNKFAA
jgi:ATP-dependent RNA helicase DeaD